MWRGRSLAFSGIGLQKQVWSQLEGGLGGCQGWKMLSQSENFIIAIAMIHMLVRYWCFDQRIMVNIAPPLVLPWAWTDWILKLWWSCLPTYQKPSQRTTPRACYNSYFRFLSFQRCFHLLKALMRSPMMTMKTARLRIDVSLNFKIPLR